MAEYATPFEDHATPSSTMRSGRGFAGSWVFRLFGAVLIVGATAGTWFGMAPETSRTDLGSQIDAAMAEEASNQEMTDGAPQQAVVNGWVASDLLEIIATQGPLAQPKMSGPGTDCGRCPRIRARTRHFKAPREVEP